MKAASSAVVTGCYTSDDTLNIEMPEHTFAFTTGAAVAALKYLLMPLLILSSFALSSSRFRLAG